MLDPATVIVAQYLLDGKKGKITPIRTMKSHPKNLFGLCAVLLIAFACHASANLVTNGGFETGDFTGWTQSGNTGFTSVSSLEPQFWKF